jgi:hypothetical protein
MLLLLLYAVSRTGKFYLGPAAQLKEQVILIKSDVNLQKIKKNLK